MYKVKLTRLHSEHTNTNVDALRTDVIEGIVYSLPTEDKSFRVIAKALYTDDDDVMRWVDTSTVKSVIKVNETNYNFYTRNSVYALEILEDLTRDVLF